MTTKKILDIKKEYICSQCKTSIIAVAEYQKLYIFETKYHCIVCKNIMKPKTSDLVPDFCMDYREIVIQEMQSRSKTPAILIVSLENDLVDSCQPGDCIILCGTIETRWRPLIDSKKIDIVMTMHANSICDETKTNFEKDIDEKLALVKSNWQLFVEKEGELEARDFIIKSFYPKIHGMHPVKLAIALALCSSGIERCQHKGMSIRRHSHLLICGDPGVAKSKLLSYAAQISIRSVQTTGMGSTSAGLTAGAYKEDNEWQLEAGALVLADGGICCIDEFNLMRDTDKASIHETMEQQTISIAKANIVCKLSTRCVILATMNPKIASGSYSINIASPLLSRFDVVLMLHDEANRDWDLEISDHVLSKGSVSTNSRKDIDPKLWTIEELQYHFLCAKKINPVITPPAYEILAQYFKWCRSDPYRDPARTTVRLLDSLTRLAQCHAKLVLRSEVTIIDAISTVRLMESSYGFGRLIIPMDLIKDKIPLGPSKDEIFEVLSTLNLEHLIHLNEELTSKYTDEIDNYITEISEKTMINASEDVAGNNLEHDTIDVISRMTPSKKIKLDLYTEEKDTKDNSQPFCKINSINDDEIDEIINFDEIENKLKEKQIKTKRKDIELSVGSISRNTIVKENIDPPLSQSKNSPTKRSSVSVKTLKKLNLFRLEPKDHIRVEKEFENKEDKELLETDNSLLARISAEANKILNDDELDFDLDF